MYYWARLEMLYIQERTVDSLRLFVRANYDFPRWSPQVTDGDPRQGVDRGPST